MAAPVEPSSETMLPLAGLRRAGRLLAFGFVILGAAAAWHWHALLSPLSITEAIAGSPAAPFMFLGGQIVASLIFIPRTVLAIASGLLFGLWWGLLWAALGSLAGAIAGFLFVRYVNSGFVDLKRSRRLGALLERVERGGWRSVAAVRLIPVVPHSLANYGLGLTRIPLGPYALGSLLGQLPMTLAYVDLGAAGQRLMLGREGWIAPTVIGFAALGFSLLIPAFARRRG